MAKIGRPPRLRIRHQGTQVLDNSIQIEALKRFGVIEAVVHRISPRRMLAKRAEVQLLRPPITVASSRTTAGKWAFARTVVVAHPIHAVSPLKWASSAPSD